MSSLVAFEARSTEDNVPGVVPGDQPGGLRWAWAVLACGEEPAHVSKPPIALTKRPNMLPTIITGVCALMVGQLAWRDPKYLVPMDEVQKWHAVKGALGPAFAETPSRRMQMT